MVETQERKITAWRNQIETQVKVVGSGPPLVFLHGAYGLQWDPFLDRLARSHTVYAPHHPGTAPGAPDGIKAVDDLWDLVLYYYEMFDELGLAAPALVGHSFGGMVAAELAATNPERVGRLVLIDPVGLWRDDAPVRNWMASPLAELPGLLFADPDGPLAKMMLAVDLDSEAAAEMRIRLMWALACTGKFVWPIPDRGLKKRLHRIKAPTLIIWGAQDGIAPPLYAQEFADRIAGSRVELVEGAGHLPQLEQAESVAGLVERFLSG